MSKHKPYYIAFSHCPGIGPMRFKQLLSHFGSAKAAYEADSGTLIHLLGVKVGGDFIKFRTHFKPDSIISDLYKKNIQCITQEDVEYPLQLREISDPPICLYVKGNTKLLVQGKKSIAVVGTRKATSYGRMLVELFVSELSRNAIMIVSGMAIGIDAYAHWTAIHQKGATIAVLGCGVDIVYPPVNRQLYHTIIETGGAIVSEFPPGTTVSKGLFIARNRIISGLSNGVVVIEGAKDSGALITARYAAEQGREVFAPPAPLTSPLAAAPLFLIKQGAKMITSPQDILDELHVQYASVKNIKHRTLNEQEQMLVDALGEPQNADDIAALLSKPITDILSLLTMLEIEGIVVKNQEGKFMRSI